MVYIIEQFIIIQIIL